MREVEGLGGEGAQEEGARSCTSSVTRKDIGRRKEEGIAGGGNSWDNNRDKAVVRVRRHFPWAEGSARNENQIQTGVWRPEGMKSPEPMEWELHPRASLPVLEPPRRLSDAAQPGVHLTFF